MAAPEQRAEPLVSVVVPVFDVAPYLPACVESILGQTYTRLEVLLVDDGSTDGSGDLCDSFARHDSRVRVIHQENQGIAGARNAGVSNATGSHLTFVDADDWVAPAFVETLLDLLRAHDADAAVAHYVRVPHDSVPRTDPPGATEPVVRTLSPDEVLLSFLGPAYPTMTVVWGKLFIRDLLDGITFPAGVNHEDEFVTYRVLHRANRTVVTAEPLYGYRQRPSSFMAQGYDHASRFDRLEALRERAEYIRRAGLGNVGYRPLLDEQLALRHHVLQGADPSMRERFDRDLRDSVRKLRGTKQPLRFRVLAEASLLTPRLADAAYRAFMRRRA